MRKLWEIRELRTVAILVFEILFFTWWLWPDGNRPHPFLNWGNGLLILKYSSIYGIAAIGAAIVIISGGIDLAPGAVMALAGVVGSQLFVVRGWGLGPSMIAGVLVGLASGLVSAGLIVLVRLPPFIATLGVMGITRGAAFIITQGEYFDVSSHLLGGWRPFGLPADWVAPIVLIGLALVFQILMTVFQWGRSVFAVGGNETAALFSGIAVGRVKTSAYAVAGLLAGISGVVLVLVQGQGKADLANGYELDIIASAVVGGSSLAGGRGSVVGAVLGTLIFGVLRNALPQIPGATFYDRLIVGLVVIVIVVMDQLLLKKERDGLRLFAKATKITKTTKSLCDLGDLSDLCEKPWIVWEDLMRKVFAVLLVGTLGVAGCGGSKPSSTTGAGGAPRLRFAVIPKSLDIPVFNYAKIGAERQAAAYGDVDILWNAPASADQLKQKEILESAITQHVDGIAISALNGDFLTDTINRAIDAGIPVVTWDSDAPKSKRIAFYGVDDLASGRIMGDQAVRLLNGKGKVAIITSMGATNLQRRLDGIKESLAKAPGIQIVEVFDIKEDPVRCAEIMATGTNRYPDLGAWLSVGGWPVFTRNATASVDPSKTKVISFDTIQPALDLLREGKVTVLLGQKYFGWGTEPVKILYDIKHGKNPASPIIDSGVDVVTKDNVEEYAAKWKKMESGS